MARDRKLFVQFRISILTLSFSRQAAAEEFHCALELNSAWLKSLRFIKPPSGGCFYQCGTFCYSPRLRINQTDEIKTESTEEKENCWSSLSVWRTNCFLSGVLSGRNWLCWDLALIPRRLLVSGQQRIYILMESNQNDDKTFVWEFTVASSACNRLELSSH